jgi:hypothetical protein
MYKKEYLKGTYLISFSLCRVLLVALCVRMIGLIVCLLILQFHAGNMKLEATIF